MSQASIDRWFEKTDKKKKSSLDLTMAHFKDICSYHENHFHLVSLISMFEKFYHGRRFQDEKWY